LASTFLDDADGGRYAQLKALVMDEMKGYFWPELLSRLDEVVVVFRSLERYSGQTPGC
jgi:ATP-dependent Clp protease ATP-binding subunit ClpC